MLKAILQIRRVLLGSFVILFIHREKKYSHMSHCPCVDVKEKLSSPGPLLHCVGIVDQIQIVWLGYKSFYFQKKGFERIILATMVANA